MKWRYLIFATILIGIIFRFGEYLPNRSLWFDEAVVAQRITEVPFGQLIDGRTQVHLAYSFGFLLLEKISIGICHSNHEMVIRFFPLMAGILSLFLFYPLAEKVLSRQAALLAALLFSIDPMASYYSSEVKSYSFDILFAIILCRIFLELRRDKVSIGKYLLYSALVFISMWFSYGSFFVLFGGGITLVIYDLCRKNIGLVKRTAWMLFIGGVSFLINYIFFLRYFVSDPGLHRYWAFVYPSSYSVSYMFLWLRGIFGYFCYIVFNYPFIWAWPFCLLGTIELYQKNKAFFSICLGATFLLTAASIFHIYPFWGRLVLFLVPLFSILFAASLEICLKYSRKFNIILGIIMAIMVIFFPLRVAARQLREPFSQQEIKQVLRFIIHNQKEGQAVYLFSHTLKAFNYYAPRFDFSKIDLFDGEARGAELEPYKADLLNMAGYKYVWVIYSHMKPEEARALEQAIRQQNGIPIDDYRVVTSKGLPPGYFKHDSISAGARLYYFKDGIKK